MFLLTKIFFLIFILVNKVKANEIFNIKIVERDDYIRILFETKEKPVYFVVEDAKENKIEVKLLNIKLLDVDLIKNIKRNKEIKNFVYRFDGNFSIFDINLFDNASLKRYLYTEPENVNNFYRLIVDIDKTKKDDLEKVLSNLELSQEEKNLNEFLYEENMFEFRNIDELISYNNIGKDEIKSFEKQNNENFEINDLLNKINILDKNEKINIKNKLNKEELKETKLNKGDIKKTTINNIKQNNKFIIVIDAGHGGKDPGAIGYKNSKEKDINLDFALEIKKELEKNSMIKVVLTRNKDEYVELFDRVILSMKNQTDLFISIHSDSSQNKNVRGFSIYSLNEEAFNTRTIEIIKQVNGMFSYLRQKNTLIKTAREQNLRQSSIFANILVDNLKNNSVRVLQNTHKKANFAVLISPNYPSILVELGFLSNKDDEKLLKNSNYRNKIAKTIASSVKRYFRI